MKNRNGTYDSRSSRDITLETAMQIMRDCGAVDFYVKKLSPNDNSKNQIYLGLDLTDLSFIPTGDIEASQTISKKKLKNNIKYQAPMNILWIDADGRRYPAPNAKLIYYPQYPEVRFSGFMQGADVNISRWMAVDKDGRSKGRWLILGIDAGNQVYAYLATPESRLSKELSDADYVEVSKVLRQLVVGVRLEEQATASILREKLLEIHQMGWIEGCKIEGGSIVPYNKLNAGGYTLEALLDISPNNIAGPDYLGWEIKQFGVTGFPAKGARPTTLVTPEPNGGCYAIEKPIEFIRRYGYPDMRGKHDRLNFGGMHIVGRQHSITLLTMRLNGFDAAKKSITDACGAVELVDREGNIAASWSFAKLMNHWKLKHSKAAYIPCMKCKNRGIIEFHYGSNIEFGIGTSFEMLLFAMSKGDVFYDPASKLEGASTENPNFKPRNQFRIKHKHLGSLYESYEIVDIAE